jgi:hypothetical protein
MAHESLVLPFVPWICILAVSYVVYSLFKTDAAGEKTCQARIIHCGAVCIFCSRGTDGFIHVQRLTCYKDVVEHSDFPFSIDEHQSRLVKSVSWTCREKNCLPFSPQICCPLEVIFNQSPFFTTRLCTNSTFIKAGSNFSE